MKEFINKHVDKLHQNESKEGEMSEFRIRGTDDTLDNWTIADGDKFITTDYYINRDGHISSWCTAYHTLKEAQAALDLYLGKQKENKVTEELRQFETGATRDANDHPEKPSYYRALSPIVLREYVKYIGRHRTTSDGAKRDWNNWKKGIPVDVYMDGLLRHTIAVWLIQQGFKSYDNHGEVTLKDSLNGILFNTIGFLHEHLKAEVETIDE